MKKNLFVCALFALVMAFTADAYAQKATGDDYKNLKKQEKMMDKELQKKATGKSLFILDEPTTGLHTHDIKKLLKILERIVENGDTVLIIEHNLDVIKVADYIIDLGPEGGDLGGTIVATGTPEEVAKVKESYTGQFLNKVLN